VTISLRRLDQADEPSSVTSTMMHPIHRPWVTRPNDLLPALADPFTWLGMAWMLAPHLWAIIARIRPVLAAAAPVAGGAALFAAVDVGLLLTYLLSESDRSPVVLVASPSFCAACSE
jgi:hypothetical protein